MQKLTKEIYETVALPKLVEEFGIKNKHALPKMEKIVVNMGIGNATKSKEVLEKAKQDLAAITGQSPSVRLAKKSVASFSVREGMPVGLKVTLRGPKMYAFFDRLIHVAMPRIRDFRGISRKSFDAEGNYNIGLVDYAVFPEIDFAKSTGKGLQITIVTTTKDKNQSLRLLELIGMPFEKLE